MSADGQPQSNRATKSRPSKGRAAASSQPSPAEPAIPVLAAASAPADLTPVALLARLEALERAFAERMAGLEVALTSRDQMAESKALRVAETAAIGQQLNGSAGAAFAGYVSAGKGLGVSGDIAATGQVNAGGRVTADGLFVVGPSKMQGIQASGATIDGSLTVNVGLITGTLAKLDVAPSFSAFVRCADFNIGGVPGRGPARRAMVAWENLLEVNYNADWAKCQIYNASLVSSREHKDNIAEITLEDAQQMLDTLTPVEFTLRRHPDLGKRAGFIAEDVPDPVATDDHKAIYPDAIVAVLTKVVQAQAQEIAALRTQVAALAGIET